MLARFIRHGSTGTGTLALPAMATWAAELPGCCFDFQGDPIATRIAQSCGLCEWTLKDAMTDVVLNTDDFVVDPQGHYTAEQYLWRYCSPPQQLIVPHFHEPREDWIAVMTGCGNGNKQYHPWPELLTLLSCHASYLTVKFSIGGFRIGPNGAPILTMPESIREAVRSLSRCRSFISVDNCLVPVAWGMGMRGVLLADLPDRSCTRPSGCTILPLSTPPAEVIQAAIKSGFVVANKPNPVSVL